MKWKKRLTDQRFVVGIVTAACACLAASCSEQQAPLTSTTIEWMPFTPLSTLELDLKLNRGPILVEFAQEFNCHRCDQMVATMDDLRSRYSRKVTFHRVHYPSAERQFQLGICPTYMLVLDGQIVGQLSGKQPYPILASRLNDLVAFHERDADFISNPSRNQNETD